MSSPLKLYCLFCVECSPNLLLMPWSAELLELVGQGAERSMSGLRYPLRADAFASVCLLYNVVGRKRASLDKMLVVDDVRSFTTSRYNTPRDW